MGMSHSNLIVDIVLMFNRLALGGYFALAGWSKVSGELSNGFGTFARSENFQKRSPGWVPDFFLTPYGYSLPWIELVLGALLVLGLFSRTVAVLTMLLLFSIALALLGAGEFFAKPGPPFHHVGIMIPLAALLAITGAGRWSIDFAWRARR